MQRREFLGHTARVVLLVPVAGALSACAGSADDSEAPQCSDANDSTGDADSHGHHLLIPAADLQDPQDRTYTSTGGDHTHEVSVSAAELADLVADCQVTLFSSSGGHDHTWAMILL